MDSNEQVLPVIHTSDRIAFKRCRRKWDLGSYMRQNLTPDKINDKLWLGTGVHYALAEYYAHGTNLLDAFDSWVESQIINIQKNGSLWDEQREMINEVVQLGAGILEHYQQWASQADGDWFVRVAFTEKDFKVPICDPATGKTVGWYEGRLDGIVEDVNGLYWLLEHKTAAVVDTTKLPLDEQCTSYIWAAEQIYGIKLEGVIYNVLRKKVPTKPVKLVKGGLSVNKNIDTTYQVYLDALIEEYGHLNAIPMQQYSEILTKLREQENKFFVRERVRRNRFEIANAGVQIFQELRDMTREDLYLYRNPTQDCRWDCDFRSVCLCMSDGSDYKELINACYKKRDPLELDYVRGDE